MDSGGKLVEEEWADFNESLLFLLPKAPSGTLRSGEGYYEPENTRPLSVTNTDNRLLANAVRYLIEPVVGSNVFWIQRGFLPGRSMLANVVDIEEAMATTACSQAEGGALFFDFAAAFPSLEHETMFRIFRRLGWPPWLLNFISALYTCNRCSMVLGGARHAGFELR